MKADTMSFSSRKVLQFAGIAFAMYLMNVIAPGDIPGVVTVIDYAFGILILGFGIWVALQAYVQFGSPHVFTETEQIHTSANKVRLITPDDPRIPPQLMIPYGGVKEEVVFLGHPDMGTSGGVLFAATYMTELLGQHLIVHGKSLPLTKEAVEGNRWMFEALMDDPRYVHGRTAVAICLWGEGPPVDRDLDPRLKYQAGDVQQVFRDFAQEVRGLSERAEGDLARKFRIAQEAQEKPDVEKILSEMKEREKRKKEGEEK